MTKNQIIIKYITRLSQNTNLIIDTLVNLSFAANIEFDLKPSIEMKKANNKMRQEIIDFINKN